jgi:membrane fusion protein (multidrug efflux system)
MLFSVHKIGLGVAQPTGDGSDNRIFLSIERSMIESVTILRIIDLFKGELLMLRLMFIALWLAALTGCGGVSSDGDAKPSASPGERAKAKAETKAAFKRREVPVSVVTVELGSIDASYQATATLSAVEEALVVARSQGVVETIFVEEGMAVAAGTTLAQLDTRRLSLDLARTETNVESLKRAFDRSKQLFEKKMISPDTYDQARFNYEREVATLALQAHDLNEATIRAPIAGVITMRHIKVGNTLQPNAQAFEMKRSDLIEAIVAVPEQELLKMAPGQSATVSVDALAGRAFTGEVLRVAPEVNPATGTFRVTVQLPNPDQALKPGMFARVDILYDRYENARLVSREALITERKRQYVYLVSDKMVTQRDVETGYTQDEKIEVLSGLEAGDQVVVRGQSALKEGSQIRVVQ